MSASQFVQPFRRPALIPILGLLVLTLMAFAIISPMNSAGSDDWIYPFYGKLRSLTVFGSNRQFGLLPVVAAEILTPGRMAYGMLTFQVLSVFGTSLVLFYLLRRMMPGYTSFALLFAIVYLLYIPSNGDQARTFYSGSVYTWVVLLGSVAALLLIEYFYHRAWWRWAAIFLGGFCAYMTVRAYESAIPVILCLPLLLIFKRRELSLRAVIIAFVIWYVFVGMGVFQFVQPFLARSSATVYQSSFFNVEQTTVQTILTDMLRFYGNSFPLEKFIGLPAQGQNYLVPGLLLGSVSVILFVLFRRHHPSATHLPRPRVLLGLILLGLTEIGLATVAFAYANIADTPKANFFAAPGQALVVVSVMGFAALALERLLSVRLGHLLTGFLFLYGITGASWYYQAQMYALAEGSQFDTSLRFFRELVALVPNTKEDTLILYDCNREVKYQWRLIDSMAGIYLYDGVRIGVPEQISWLPDKLNYEFIDWLDAGASYDYNQLIIIGCATNHLYVKNSFPARFLPVGVKAVDYNPFMRIVNDFIPPERGRILGY
jgi:hypothetical protein